MAETKPEPGEEEYTGPYIREIPFDVSDWGADDVPEPDPELAKRLDDLRKDGEPGWFRKLRERIGTW